ARVGLYYREQAGDGHVALEIAGELVATDIGADLFREGLVWVPLFTAADGANHSYSLVLPYGADVDFLGLRLTGGSGGLLANPEERPSVRYTAYGDLITNGTAASGITTTYPYLVGELNDWQVINMGFSGQNLTPADGTAVGALPADVISVAIGTNDFWFIPGEVAFKADYNAFLDNIRAQQPTTPIYVITPLWAYYDGLDYFGSMLEDYRRYIRDVVAARQAADHRLMLIEGYDILPPTASFFADGIHPTDEGYGIFASSLAQLNLIRNGDFEWDDASAAWVNWGNSGYTQAQVLSGERSLQVGPGAGGRGQSLGGLVPGECYRLTAFARQVGTGGMAWFGVTFYDEAGTEVSSQQATIASRSYEELSLEVIAPEAYASALVWTWKDEAGFAFIDLVSLTEATACGAD
ncbi:MAG: GDSL-type esterase/lipase family protein, partial [Pseudomonadota bacterium]